MYCSFILWSSVGWNIFQGIYFIVRMFISQTVSTFEKNWNVHTKGVLLLSIWFFYIQRWRWRCSSWGFEARVYFGWVLILFYFIFCNTYNTPKWHEPQPLLSELPIPNFPIQTFFFTFIKQNPLSRCRTNSHPMLWNARPSCYELSELQTFSNDLS